MPKYRVQGLLQWTEERSEMLDLVVEAPDEWAAREEAALEEWGVVLGDDLMHQNSFFSEETYVEEVTDDDAA